jgi:hypothetical protein
MSKQVLIALAAGAASALASLSIATGSVLALLMMYAAPLPLFLAGLSQGPRSVALAVASGFAVTGLVGGTPAAALFGLVHGIPAWLVVRQLLAYRMAPGGAVEWPAAGAVIALLATMAAGTLAGAATALSGDGGLETTVSNVLDQAFRALALPDPLREGWLSILVPLFPGFAGASWVVMTVLNAILAQGILARQGKALRPTPAFTTLAMPDWASWGLLGAAGLVVAASGMDLAELRYAGRNIALVMMVPFFFLGLAVVHSMARQTLNGTMLLAAFYLLVLVFDGAKLLVAGIGVVEHWVGLRRRIAARAAARKPDDGEEE